MGTFLYEVHYNDSDMDFYNAHHFSGSYCYVLKNNCLQNCAVSGTVQY